jgi:hypothetical protein
MLDWDSFLTPRFGYLVIGLIFIVAAVASICAGKTIARYVG